MQKQFRPRGIEADGQKYYQEHNGDYLSINPSTLDYYLKNIGKPQMEGRATAIKHDVSSVCTTAISLSFLRKKCHRVRKADIPKEWAKKL